MTMIDTGRPAAATSTDTGPTATQQGFDRLARHTAPNYAPLPVLAASAQGAWITDVEGRRLLDCLSAYSAVNFGHANPEILAVAHDQLDRLTLVSRAFGSDRLADFCSELAALCGKDLVLPMNTGAEAVETALKTARKWGHDVKGAPEGRGTIIVADGNFHGRTISIVSFSDDPVARGGFGPYTPGFRSVPYGDATALAAAIDETTVAVLLEPIQGEAGVIIPPEDYLPEVRRVCTERGVLMICDEIQAGLGRAGTTFASDLWGVVPDVYVLGKALGGGVMPVSAVVADADVLGVLTPGTHGSTFGGNPLAAAIGTQVVRMLADGSWQRRSAELGVRLRAGLESMLGSGVTAVRCRGLWAGIDIDPAVTARTVCRALAEPSVAATGPGDGVLVKDTHTHTIRIAPPLMITAAEIDWMLDRLRIALAETLG